MFRRRLSPLNESYRPTVVVGCVVGAIAGAVASVLSITSTTNANFGYATMLLDNVVGFGLLIIVGVLLGIVIGGLVGAIEAGASFAIAFVAADRNWSVRSVFVTFGMLCVLLNTTIAASVCALFLGLEGTALSDYSGILVIAVATMTTSALFGYAQSLDWPTAIDIREMPEHSKRVDRSSQTLQYDGLVDATRTRLHDEWL